MKSSIIQQCPNCGCYCEATSKGAFARMVGTVLGQSESVGSFGGKYLGNLGKFAGKVFGGVTGAPEGVFNAIAGDRYQFTCPNCKASWSTNTDEGDETNSFNLWHEVVGNVERVHAVLAAKNQNEIQEYIGLLQNELADENCVVDTEAVLHDALAYVYMEQGEKSKALEHINRSIKLFPDPNSRALKGCIMGEGRGSADAYSAMKEILHHKKSRER